jgi:pSer/pThr/pTyr-binding forkhead associated (FHA) protein
MPYRIRHQRQEFELPVGELTIGRSPDCRLSFDDPRVSRRHAVIVVTKLAVTLRDLGSRNGVLVGGERVRGERVLAPGDVISVGSQELVLSWSDETRESDEDTRPTQTVPDLDPAPLGVSDAKRDRPAREQGARVEPIRGTAPGEQGSRDQAARDLPTREQTVRDEAPAIATGPSSPPSARRAEPAARSQTSTPLQVLTGVAEKSFALGRADEAERILQSALLELRDRSSSVDDPLAVELAARWATRLAGATGKGSWLQYVFDLYAPSGRPVPGPVIDELYKVARKVRGFDPKPLRAYLSRLRAAAGGWGPGERFLLQRLEGLEKLLSLG